MVVACGALIHLFVVCTSWLWPLQAAMVEQRIEEDLFAMLDNETDPR